MSTDLMELASRVEAGEGPDRELDAEILAAIAGTANGPVSGAPAYTASLDAAMTLVNGVGVLMNLSDIGADGLPMARVGCPQFDSAPIFTGIASCIMTKTAPVAGLAMALTAAALRAHARQGAAHVDQ